MLLYHNLDILSFLLASRARFRNSLMAVYCEIGHIIFMHIIYILKIHLEGYSIKLYFVRTYIDRSYGMFKSNIVLGKSYFLYYTRNVALIHCILVWGSKTVGLDTSFVGKGGV